MFFCLKVTFGREFFQNETSLLKQGKLDGIHFFLGRNNANVL